MNSFLKILMPLLAVLIYTSNTHAESVRQANTVVELFTSQGCSSCPPADKIMGDLIKEPGVLGLSFAVTYWDYIGWKDTFGSAKNDERQTQYRDKLNARYVYTPQMIIAGADHFVGSNLGQLKDNLQRYDGHAKKIPLSWSLNQNKLTIELPKSETNAVIWQIDIDHNQPVVIGRGENNGRTITYHNIVRKSQIITSWEGQKKSITLNLEDLKHEGRDGCAILVQEQGFGPIVAALIIDL